MTKNLLTISAVTESSMQYSGGKSDQIDVVDVEMGKSLAMIDKVGSAAKSSSQSFSV